MSVKLNPGAQRTAAAPKDAEKGPVPAWQAADETLKSAPSLQGALGNQAVLRRLGGPPALILEDSAAEIGPGQMRKSEFLRLLRSEVTRTSEEGLAHAGRTTRDCPYLRVWFRHYDRQSAEHLGHAIRGYAPETAGARDAGACVQPISERVRRAVDTWVETGEITGVPASLHEAVSMRTLPGRLGRGQPLDAGTRQRMEGVFRSDFSGVRVHTEEEAGAFSQSLQAKAVTIGEDIAFAPGSYQPGTPVGDAILAHELAHVVQQQGAPEESSAATAVETPTSLIEREAESSAAGAVIALWGADRKGAQAFTGQVKPASRSRQRLQRCSANTVTSPPHTFKSCGFSASVGGALTITDEPLASRVKVKSPRYEASGEVSISGGTDAQAQDWEAGFIQTDHDSRIQQDYFNSTGTHHIYRVVALPGPTRDGDAGIMPWYEIKDVKAFPKTNSTVKTSMTDAPTTRPPWTSPDGAGTLVASSGHDRFCSWLIVRQKSTAKVLYLNWATWEVDWAASFDPVAKTGKGTGAGSRVTNTGKDQGSLMPQLGDPVANDAVTVTWVP